MEKKKITIVTHGSKFHLDELFGVATLMLVLEKDHEIILARSRDVEIIRKADYSVDVGGEYDPERNRFDHHQIGGAGSRPIDGTDIQYASFGLVWKKFGQMLCEEKIAQEIDKRLVQPIDMRDNGQEIIESVVIPGVYPYDVRDILNAFRPTWKEPEDTDEIFIRLVSYAQVLLIRQIKVLSDEAEAERNVIQAYENAEDKRIIMLDERYPWENVLRRFPEPLFVIYPKRGDGTWSLKTIRNDFYSYENRKDLPEGWAGRQGSDLQKITGVAEALFCHNNRFLVTAKTKEAVLRLAEIALKA